MEKRRVVVTGMGMLSPLGLDVDSTWSKILAGKSGVKPVTEFDADAFSVKIVASLPEDFNAENYIPVKELKKMDISLQLGIIAAEEAWRDAAITVTEDNAHRMGVSIGSGIGGLSTIESTHAIYEKSGPRRISPFFIPATIINMISGHVAINLGLKGPNLSIVTACTTGTHNIGHAMRSIMYGDADVMLAGGAEKASCPLGLGGFAAARALSKRNDDPEGASRPWDKDRDGFVLGDGSAVLVLEEYEHAVNRGANIYAEVLGYGMTADAFHMTLPSGEGGYRSMENAIRDAGIQPHEIDYINAHGTSTVKGDVVESQAIEQLMGDASSKVKVSSTKSMIGHLLGAAGALEAVFSVLAIRDGVAPPTINLDNCDEGCHLNYVPHEAQAGEINVSMSNSFGFGGTNGTLVFRKVK